MIQTITVLGHEIMYDSEGIVMDESLLNELHDAVNEEICDGKTNGIVELLCDINVGTENVEYGVEFNVTWRIVDWKEIADKLYKALNDVDTTTMTYTEELVQARKMYEDATGK